MPRMNDEVAARLDELARLTKVDEQDPNSFRVRAYERAARAIEALAQDVGDMSANALTTVDGVGKSTAAKIRQYVDEGRIDKLEALREQYPPGQLELLDVPGLGPKMLALLDDVLGVRDLAGLQAALADGRFADLPGLGDRTAENLSHAIDRMHLASKNRRRPIHDVLPVAERLVADLEAVEGVHRVAFAGSLRRFRDTIGDIDLLVSAADPAVVTAAFTAHDVVSEVAGSGDTKTSIVTRDGLSVDLRVVSEPSFGAALVYFTGSKGHNIALRQRAIDRGWTLSEYALSDAETDEVVAGTTEEEVYEALGLAWVTPELREDNGEVARAAEGALDRLVAVSDLRGDLHDHTDWSGDGRNTMEEMVAAAADRGLDYLAITDHAEDLRINGIDRAGMRRQRGELRDLEQARGDLRLLHGVELNIATDGSVDYDPTFLADFDFGVASVHSAFTRSVADQTERLETAIRNPAVNVIGHPSGRKLGRRPGIEFDLEQVIAACLATGTALEINSNLHRLDATAEVVRQAGRAGVLFAISTDAHTTRELANARHGVSQARRGGLPVDQVVNTWPRERFLDWVSEVRSG